MIVEFDTEAQATYFRVSDEERAAETVDLSDELLVDVDEHGRPIGVDVLRAPAGVDEGLLALLASRFPEVAEHVAASLRGLAGAA